MYILTIVLLFTPVTVVSSFANQGACEDAARRSRSFSVGPQAVRSATCDLAVGAPIVP
jgi:hypothetical protein